MRSAAMVMFLAGALSVPAFAQEAAKKPSTQQLIEQLGDTSYKNRRAAEEALRDLGKSALDALRKAAKDSDEPEVRWRAGRLVQEIESGKKSEDDSGSGGLHERTAPGNGQSGTPQWGPGRLDNMFDSLFQRLERNFGVDVPRHRFFADPFFGDLQKQFDDLRRAQQGLPGKGESMRLNIGPNGVALELEHTNEKGERDTKRYEAPDMKAFRAKYPEIAKRYLDGRGTVPQLSNPDRWFGGLRQMPQWGPVPVLPQHNGLRMLPADNGPKLGVYIKPMSDDLRGFLGLQSDQGLLVDHVQSDSLASRLGIEAGDVVLRVDGQDVGTPQEVSHALQQAGDKVAVEVNRRGKTVKLEAATQAPHTDEGLEPKGKKRV